MAESVKKRNTSRCCGVVHVRTFALIIVLLEIAFLIYQSMLATSYVFSASSSNHGLLATVYSLAVLVAWVAVTLLLLGILCQIPTLLVPHMLMQVLFVIAQLSMALFAVYAVVAGTALQVRIAVVGAEHTSLLQDSMDTSSFKVSFVSGFLTGLLVLIIVGYFIGALFSVSEFLVTM
ncbi:hypothetical protein NECAME_06628 [Necator americanus]|uniref:Uncharacterized protein n=1 Tax=Necator americanus TaxID=51031 RepID=W2TTB6_NECAM|nr:hypothetical protein NECAME_06628 [Necator americanus]ETN84904.1 hypothetical protein NECAME_06628 [Necator americanus]